MNVQQVIIEGIKEQLFHNNYLVLPGFGGFVLKHSPAHYTASATALMPPSKTVSFNSQLKINDGVMTLWLQEKLKIDSAAALASLQEFGTYCHSVLQSRRRLNIDGIGFFYLDFENNICFEPQADMNFMTESFGLSPLYLKELPAHAELPKQETVFIERKAVETPEHQVTVKPKRTVRRFVVPAIAGLAVIGLLSLLVLNSNIRGQLNASVFGTNSPCAFTPLTYPELTLEAPQTPGDTYVADANGIAVLKLDENSAVAVKVIATEGTVKTSLTTPTSTHRVARGNFEIVLGCFSVHSNAEKMIKKLEGQNISAFISGLRHKGMDVVSCGSYETKDEAAQQLQELRQKFPHAWIKSSR